MDTIKQLIGREVLDSRATPTVQVDLITNTGLIGRATVPSGASTGQAEAHELRDKDPHRYHGKGVLNAIAHVNGTIQNVLMGMHVCDQAAIDKAMISLDGSPNKQVLGANALLGVSFAAAKAACQSLQLPLYAYLREHVLPQAGLSRASGSYVLPLPMANVLNGGVHATGICDLQEFMIMPTKAPSFREGVRWMSEIFHTLKELLKQKGHATTVGDEGGFAPMLRSNEEAIDLLLEAISLAGYSPGEEVHLALDPAASELYKRGPDKKYTFWKSNNKHLSSEEMIDFWQNLIQKYPQIVSLEDALDEEDWHGWQRLSKQLNHKVQLVGDDLFVTNPQRLQKGIKHQICNAILIKPNQVGTLTETLRTICLAQEHGYACVMSHRSGETEDTLLADLAVGAGIEQIKTGSVCRSDRTAKYNRLLLIEEWLHSQATYSQMDALGHKKRQRSFLKKTKGPH